MKRCSMAVSWFVCAAAAASTMQDPYWAEDSYEPRTPVLSGAVAGGFHGAVAPMARMDARSVAALDGNARRWSGAVWRGERVNAQFALWTGDGARQTRIETSGLAGPDGATIPASACRARFLRYVLASQVERNGRTVRPEELAGDCLDDADRVDIPPGGFRPFWLTIDVPERTPPGIYTGKVAAVAQGGRRVEFDVSLDVLPRTLPAPADWAFFLDLWQHPLAVARYHGVKPWSKEHYALLRPLLRELASAGQKTVTATLVDLPWNHQNFDPYQTMVGHVKGADGSFSHDYSLFDEWVEFALSCGLGPQIHCYAMVPWGNFVYWTDGATGDTVREKLVPGTSAHEAFWGPFLADFEKHVARKGWLGRVYIALDERSREELAASAAVLKKYAPGLKIQMAGNRPPDSFAGIEIHNYSQGLRANHVTQAFKDGVAARRAKGFVTTTYVCCNPPRPNTFVFSPYAEQRWFGLYAAAQGFDGMLRWAAFNWPRAPLYDVTYSPRRGSWPPGDTFLIYPGPRASVRWENLRDSIENFEKVRILRASGASTARLEAALAKIDYTSEAASGDEKDFAARVKEVEDAIDEASAAPAQGM